MPNITVTEAKAIHEAFGPCTGVYECWEIDELIEDMRTFKGTISEWLGIQLTCEGVTADRTQDAACHQQESGAYPEDHHKQVIEETNTFLGNLQERVEALKKQHGW